MVADTEQSLAFYRNQLGLRVAGESENYGPEQERLNNVFGARLRMTSLAAAAGPGIELLQYLAPATTPRLLLDAAANDIGHWHVRVSTGQLSDVKKGVAAARGRLASSHTVGLTALDLGFRAGLMVRDPDGHVLLFGRSKKRFLGLPSTQARCWQTSGPVAERNGYWNTKAGPLWGNQRRAKMPVTRNHDLDTFHQGAPFPAPPGPVAGHLVRGRSGGKPTRGTPRRSQVKQPHLCQRKRGIGLRAPAWS
ncbi:MAG: VOC family protein [Gammaproteobacteria bacterium]